jgi:hypothetical protein
MSIVAILLSQILLAIILTIVRRFAEITKPAPAIFGCELMLVPPLLALADSREAPHPGIVLACIAGLVIGYILLGKSIGERRAAQSS